MNLEDLTVGDVWNRLEPIQKERITKAISYIYGFCHHPQVSGNDIIAFQTLVKETFRDYSHVDQLRG